MQGPTYLVPVNEQGNWKSQPDTSAAGRDQSLTLTTRAKTLLLRIKGHVDR